MSVIAFKKKKNEILVAADGIVLSDDKIEDNDFKKIHKISDSLIIGATGLADAVGIYKKFVEANRVVFEKLEDSIEAIALFKRLRDYFSNNFGYADETIKEFGGFLVVNKKFHGVFYFDDHLTPYSTRTEKENTSFAFGSTGIYTTALIDTGMDIVAAIMKSAEKYNSINSNVTLLKINLE